MRVLYLMPQPKRPDRIGAYTFLDEEVQALAAAGIETFVLTTKQKTDTWCGRVRLKAVRPRLTRRSAVARFLATRLADVPWGNVLSPRVLYRAARLEYLAATVVEKEKIDLIHSHFAWPEGLGGSLARAATGRPLVASLRGNDILLDRKIAYGRRVSAPYDRALRTLLRRADRTVYFSNYMRDHAIGLGAAADSARVIRKGVNIAQFEVAADRAALRVRLGFGDRPMILTVAGLIERKGVHHILQALALLRAERDFTFVVCGDGPERPRLEALSTELGLADRTVFMGRVDRDKIPSVFAASDIFVLASLVEAAGNVLFEAMSAGRPVVCTDSGGPAEYVTDGETGFVVPVADPRAMAEKIGRLLDDPALQERLGREGRRRTCTEFDYGRMVSDIVEVYRETLNATGDQQALAHRAAGTAV